MFNFFTFQTSTFQLCKILLSAMLTPQNPNKWCIDPIPNPTFFKIFFNKLLHTDVRHNTEENIFGATSV